MTMAPPPDAPGQVAPCTATTMRTNVGIYLYPDIEVLDFAGPHEVFTTANRAHERRNSSQAGPFHVFSVAQTGAAVSARAGLRISPDHCFADHAPIDCLVVPGGVVTAELAQPAVMQWLGQCAANAGILTRGPVTTHREDQAQLAQMFPTLEVLDGPRWVEQGRLFTSAGISAGIDLALH